MLSSIETGRPSSIEPARLAAPRQPALSSASISSTAEIKRQVRRASTAPQDSRLANTTSKIGGVKRKAEDQSGRPSSQPPSGPGVLKSASISTASNSRPSSAKVLSAPKSPAKTQPNKALPALPKPQATAATTLASKPPPKGSFADLMAKAKALQEKAPAEVGRFKHQPLPREKISKAERRRRALEVQTKSKTAQPGGKPVGSLHSLRTDRPQAGVSTGKRNIEEQPSYKGTARPPQSPPASTYRGTASLPVRRQANRKERSTSATKRSRMNEYLGTDEEDEGDIVDDYDDHYSDESSDMEAGLDDMEEEEAAALAAAQLEDEQELRAELAAKKEKLDRRKKLAALASKMRR